MSEIRFLNSLQWQSVTALTWDKEGKATEQKGSVVSFDDEAYESLSFSDGETKTSKLFPGKLALTMDYKKIPSYETPLTFFHAEGKTGYVDTYVLRDEKNLAYRKGSKKINVFVPEGYDGSKPYGLLYCFDAQNLFSHAGDYTKDGDPYGSWQLDVVLQELKRQYGKEILVVAIDNADLYRMAELLPDLTSYGGISELARRESEDVEIKPHLDELADFMKYTVHPLILEKYAIDEKEIGICGASMGGLASLYCALRDLGAYQYVLSYSPAYGLYEEEAFDNWLRTLSLGTQQAKQPKLHIYCGAGDPLERDLLPLSRRMKSLLVKHGYEAERIHETYDPEKLHNEESWRLILPESFSFLLEL